jgi:trk system potassium uptake protein TrkA
MSSNVLIAGAGRVGIAVAAALAESRHRVTIIDPSAARIAAAQERVPGMTGVVGDGTDPADLESAGIRTADAVAALSGSDEVNLVVTSLARHEFAVPRCIARVVDPARSWLFTPEMGVDVALEQADLIARLVAEELSLGEMTRLVKLRQGQYELVEERVHPHAAAAGRTVAGLGLPRDCLLVAIFREGEPQLVRGDSTLEGGDEVLAVVRSGAAAALSTLFDEEPGGGT